MKNFKQIKAIEAKNKQRILSANSKVNDYSGIYILTRFENDFKYFYVGQSLHILSRLAQHLAGYQHIDLSLKKHGLYSSDNPTGWKIGFINCSKGELDELEQKYIKEYISKGFVTRNKTGGSQGKGKIKIDDFKPSKGYQEGLQNGYNKARKEVSHWFELHLDVKCKSEKSNKNQEKALQKFNNFINLEE